MPQSHDGKFTAWTVDRFEQEAVQLHGVDDAANSNGNNMDGWMDG